MALGTRQQQRPGRTATTLRRLVLVACVVTMAALPGASAATSSTGRVAGSCALPRYPGTGYFTSLSVSRVSCATGQRLMVAYYHCRLRTGRAGRCAGGVLGYSCQERRNSIPTEIDARVTCRRHAATIVHTYQQDT